MKKEKINSSLQCEPEVSSSTMQDLYDYELPPGLIAQHPAELRDKSRLMMLEQSGGISHSFFNEIHTFFQAGDMLVINETRVSAFCLDGVKAGGDTRVSCLISERLDDTGHVYRAIAKPLRRLKPGTEIIFSELLRGKIINRDRYTCTMQLETLDPALSVDEILDRVSRPALPPYIKRHEAVEQAATEDWVRYQTVYTRVEGSIAAPTAGLHFTPDLLAKLTDMGVRIFPIDLKIGAGTFRPIKVDDFKQHEMEEESFDVSEDVWRSILEGCRQGNRLFAVGTTVIRALESIESCQNGDNPTLKGKTGLFVYPGYEFRLPYAGLITNFHLPRSTLLLLVSAFGGTERMKRAYAEAVARGYRFYSYGDAMFIMSAPGSREE